jgi:hypothetical protein
LEGATATPRPAASDRGTLLLGPDGFFDGRIFDPDRVEDHLSDLHADALKQGIP